MRGKFGWTILLTLMKLSVRFTQNFPGSSVGRVPLAAGLTTWYINGKIIFPGSSVGRVPLAAGLTTWYINGKIIFPGSSVGRAGGC
jgi:hypothetical protein